MRYEFQKRIKQHIYKITRQIIINFPLKMAKTVAVAHDDRRRTFVTSGALCEMSPNSSVFVRYAIRDKDEMF